MIANIPRMAANAVGAALIIAGAAIVIPGAVIAIPGLLLMEETGLLSHITKKFDKWLGIRQELLEDDD